MDLKKVATYVIVFIIVLLLLVKLVIPIVGAIFKFVILGAIILGAIRIYKRLTAGGSSEG